MLFYNILVTCCVVVLVNGDESTEASTPAPAPPNIEIVRYAMCKDHEDTPAKFFTNITKKSPTVFLISGEGETPYPIGDNIVVHFIAETFDNNEWSTLIKLDEKDPCQLLNDYVGETWHELEKKLNIPVGECPIPKGKYSMKDYVFDLEKIIPASSIPKGHVRIQAKASQEDELVLCLEAEIVSS